MNILPQNRAEEKAESKGKAELRGTQYFFMVFAPRSYFFSQSTGIIPTWLMAREAQDQMRLIGNTSILRNRLDLQPLQSNRFAN